MPKVLSEYNLGNIEMAGESYPSKIDYELDPEDGAILIYAVRILKKSARGTAFGTIKMVTSIVARNGSGWMSPTFSLALNRRVRR